MASFSCTLHDRTAPPTFTPPDPVDDSQVVEKNIGAKQQLSALRKDNTPCGLDCGLHEGADLTVCRLSSTSIETILLQINEPWYVEDRDVLIGALKLWPNMLHAATWNLRCVEVIEFPKYSVVYLV